MTAREKLIALIQSAVGGCARHWAELIADNLISNGVTFAKDTDVGGKWISVEDDTPKDRRDVLVSAFWHETWQTLPGWYAPNSKIWHVTTAVGDKADLAVSHWREVPEPPREE